MRFFITVLIMSLHRIIIKTRLCALWKNAQPNRRKKEEHDRDTGKAWR